jgi:hypothetical protein
MAVPRPLLLAFLGLALIGTAFMATRNAREQTHSSPAAPSAKHAVAQPSRPATPKPSSPSRARSAKADLPASHRSEGLARRPATVARAITHGRVVVLAFFQRGGLDDAQTAQAVASLRGRAGVAVVTDRIDHVDRYAPMIGKLGLSEAPAVVIIDSHRRARLVEGYVDREALAQEVADLRR